MASEERKKLELDKKDQELKEKRLDVKEAKDKIDKRDPYSW